jgi:hypothetical protein
MAKQTCTNYSIIGGAITLTGVNVPLSQILLIADASSGMILHAVGQAALAYTQSANSTIVPATPPASNLDSLLIYYEDGIAAPSPGQKAADKSQSVVLAADQPFLGKPVVLVPQAGSNQLTAAGQTVTVQVKPGAAYVFCISTITTLGAVGNTLTGCMVTKGSTSVAYTGAAPKVGQLLGGTGIPAGAFVKSVVPGTGFTMSLPATASGTQSVGVTAGSFSGVFKASSDGNTFSPVAALPLGFPFDATATAAPVAPGLYRYIAGPNDRFLQFSLSAISLAGAFGAATAFAVRVDIDAYDRDNGAIAIPFVSYTAATSGTFPVGIPLIMPIDTIGLSEITLDIASFSGTSQAAAWRQTGATDGGSFNSCNAVTSSSFAANAQTATTSGTFTFKPSARFFFTAYSAGSIVNIAVAGANARLSNSNSALLSATGINSYGGAAVVSARPNSGSSSAPTVGLISATSSVDINSATQATLNVANVKTGLSAPSPGDGMGGFVGFLVNLASYTPGACTGIDLFLQDSPDNANWRDIFHIPRLSGAGVYFVPPLQPNGRRRWAYLHNGAAPTAFSLTVTAAQHSIAAPKVVQFFDRTNGITSGPVSVGDGAAWDITGCKQFTFAIDAGTASIPAQFKIQFAVDGQGWFDVSASEAVTPGAITPIPINAGSVGRLARFVCTNAGSSAQINSGHIFATA